MSFLSFSRFKIEERLSCFCVCVILGLKYKIIDEHTEYKIIDEHTEHYLASNVWMNVFYDKGYVVFVLLNIYKKLYCHNFPLQP